MRLRALTYTVTTRARWRSLLHRLLSVIRFCITVPSRKIRNTSGCTDRYRRDVPPRFTICFHVHIIAGVGFALALINRQRVQIFAWLAVFFFVGLKGRRTTLSVASLVVLAICRYSLDHDAPAPEFSVYRTDRCNLAVSIKHLAIAFRGSWHGIHILVVTAILAGIFDPLRTVSRCPVKELLYRSVDPYAFDRPAVINGPIKRAKPGEQCGARGCYGTSSVGRPHQSTSAARL